MENLIFRTVAALNTNINEIKNKISNITNLFTLPENKIADQFKHINTPEFNTLRAETFAVRLPQAKFSSKSCTVNFVKNTAFDYKLKNIKEKCYSEIN